MALFCAQFHEAGVDREAVEPGPESRIPPETLNSLGHLHEHVHEDVFGLVAVLQHAEGEVQHVRTVPLPEQGERFAAAVLEMLKYHFFVHSTLLMHTKEHRLHTGKIKKVLDYPQPPIPKH